MSAQPGTTARAGRGRDGRRRGASLAVVAALLISVVPASGAAAGVAGPVPASVPALVLPSVVPAGSGVTVNGRGYGHGRGMGQYGSLGYAVDHGWSSAQILDHFYGGTRADTIPNLPIGVELLSLRGRAVALTGPGLAVDGTPAGSPAVLVERDAAGTVRVRTGPGCAGPWSAGSVRPAGATVTTTDGAVGVCEVGRVRGYRGNLKFVDAKGATSVVNQLLVEDYLRGVVPRESPASWSALGGGRGAHALQAQTVAARSYALSATYSPYATTCDTTACQVYGGAWTRSQTTGATTSLEDLRTDAAIAAVVGVVRRMPDGRVARTEFSSSTGGQTAGGTFPAVPDLGDATASNPNRAWRVQLSAADLAARLGTGPVSDLRVSRRNGLGPDGGRVLEVTVVSGSTTTTLSGNQVRTRLGLKSDWFTLSDFVSGETAAAVVDAMWRDVLGRAPSTAEREQRAAEILGGRSAGSLAVELARSRERAQGVVAGVYRTALDRNPAQAEIQGWMTEFTRDGSVPRLQASVLASQEAWLRSGGSATAWVDRMYRVTLGRSAAQGEREFWAARIPGQGRAGVAMSIAGSKEAALRRLDGYYRSLLGRAPDPGAGVHLPGLLGAGSGDVGVPAALAGSPEYVARARARF